MASDLERLGPTFVKLGQLLSSRSDLLRPEYIDALARLQDDCEPFPFADVEQIVQDELGVRMSRLFSEFEDKPIAAASLGQVHRARLRDGREVAVKVQRPGIRRQLADDLEVLSELTDFFDAHSDNAVLTEQGYTIRHIETWHRETDHSCIVWDAPDITEADLPY